MLHLIRLMRLIRLLRTFRIKCVHKYEQQKYPKSPNEEIVMNHVDERNAVLNDDEAEMAKTAQRCIMKALDHSRAQKIKIVDESGEINTVLEVPPKALRLFAELLGAMSQRQLISIVPQGLELSTQEAAAMLNVSRPFIIKLIEEGKLECRKVGRHRRIEFDALSRYREQMKSESATALQRLADNAQALKMGY
jgi:excisionase family DNA binding protein